MSIIQAPLNMAQLQRDSLDRPVPWFVAWIDGKPDHRIVDPHKLPLARKSNLCWLCGRSLHRFKSFVVGPMCGVNRVSSEPPSHLACAVYAAQVCPFMTTPGRERRTTNLPEERDAPAGIGLARNPGVTLIWTTRKYLTFLAPNGILFDMGEPAAVQWWAEGRYATRQEIIASVETGLPALKEAAAMQGADAEAALKVALDRFWNTVLPISTELADTLEHPDEPAEIMTTMTTENA